MEAGTRIGSYEIIAPIDAGGMGVVYRARHVDLGREVAIKVLLPNLMLSEKIRDRFKQEAYVQAQLEHPHIVRVSDAIQETDHYAIVMELVKGGSLADKLTTTSGAWSEAEFRSLFDPIVDAVAYAHSRGIVHRDIKPGNILLTEDGTPKVSDFGIAKILAADSGMTRTGTKMGTAPYMAPEQFEGQKDLGAPADVYALGMLAWRLLTGCLPVDADNLKSVFSYYMGDKPLPPIQEAIPRLSPDLASIIDSCLNSDPTQRPKDAGVLQTLLQSVPNTNDPEQPTPPVTTEPKRDISEPLSEPEMLRLGHQDTLVGSADTHERHQPRKKTLVVASAIAVIGLLIFASYHFLDDGNKRTRKKSPAEEEHVEPATADHGEAEAANETEGVQALKKDQPEQPAKESLPWYLNDQEAKTFAKDTGKPLMVHLWAKWCPPCEKLENLTYTDPEVRRLLNQFVLAKLDVTDFQDPLWQTYDDLTLPAVVFFQPDGTRLRELELNSFESGPAFKERLEKVLNAPKAEPKQLAEGLSGIPMRGATNPAVVIIESADFQCPFCDRAQETLRKVVETYPNDVAIYFFHNPLAFHGNAMPAAKAAAAAHRQGKFWEMHDKCFANAEALTSDNFTKWASEIGLDMTRFKEDMADPTLEAEIKRQQATMVALGARGTPNFFINGEQMKGAQPFSAFQEVIDRQWRHVDVEITKGKSRSEAWQAVTRSSHTDGDNFLEWVVEGETPPTEVAEPTPDEKPVADNTVWRVHVNASDAQKGGWKPLVTLVEFADFQ